MSNNYVTMNIRMYASKPDKVMEQVILNLGWEWYSASKACEYARKVIKGRWIKGERKIKKNPYSAYFYARHVIGGRWPEAEKFILKDEHASYLYAKYVLKGRFEKAEKKRGLFKSPREIYFYSKYVMKSRWKEKENAMVNFVVKNTWGFEKVFDYCIQIRKERWPQIEGEIVKSSKEYIGRYFKLLKEKDKEEFYNKVLAQSLVEPRSSWQRNEAREFIKTMKN